MELNPILADVAEPHPSAVRAIGMADLWAALREGFDDYRAMRGEMLFLGLIYPIVGLLAFAFIFGGALPPLAFPLAAGVSLMGPAVASGFYELSRLRETGKEPNWRDAFSVLNTPPLANILALTAIVAVLFALWMAAAWAIFAATMGTGSAEMATFWARLYTTPQGWTMMIVGDLVGAVFAAVVLTISVVSFPMLVDRKAGPLSAVETSVFAVRKSPATFAAWGVIVAALLVIGSIPLFVGLAIVLPVLGYATWRLYTRVVVR